MVREYSQLLTACTNMSVNTTSTLFQFSNLTPSLNNFNKPDIYFSGLAAVSVLFLVAFVNVFAWKVDGFPLKRGIPFVGCWAFFTSRESFVTDGLRRFGNHFIFYLIHHKILIVSGESARRTYFQHKELNFQEGYKVLLGGTMEVDHLNKDKIAEDENANLIWFGKRLNACLRADRLKRMIPDMMQDLEIRMQKWGSSGRFMPSEDIYEMVFQLTTRTLAFAEIANSPELVKRTAELYWLAEKGSTATSLLLPWFPSRARRSRLAASTDMYNICKKLYDERMAEGKVYDDAIQILIQEGDEFHRIVEFVLGSLFAGVINTGVMASWIPIFLAFNSEWKERVLAEIRTFMAKHVDSSTTANTKRLSENLGKIPPSAWEQELPLVDLCIRETIRVVMIGVLLRRSFGDDIKFGQQKVKPGTFIGFPVTSVHHDPKIYPNPTNWDPSRFERGEDKKEHWGFIGWGVGRHPCLGMRFAQLEIKAITILFLMQFEYTVEDAHGKPLKSVPEIDKLNTQKLPPKTPTYLRYKRIAD